MSTLRRLLRAGGRLYRRLFRRRLDTHTREVATVLQSVPAFERLSSRALYAMASATHRRTYRRGESLYYEGDPGLGLYVVESGCVRLISDAGPNRSRELRELEASSMFGELSILGDFNRLETAETITEARVLGFFRPDLKNVMRRNPKAGAEIVMALARRVAAQHVEAVRLLEEREGRDAALDTYTQAASRVEAESSPLS
ncbi:MAG: Crp/Fnr family transcriptional regulator [Salinibacter sp.]